MLKRKKEEPEIDVGAFSDIAFLMIIFFILTTQIVKFTGNTMSVPSGKPSKEQKKEDKQITINLTGSSIEFGEGSSTKSMTIEELKARLIAEDLPGKPEDKRFVIVDSKKDVPYEVYFQVVMAITNAGGTLSLVDYDSKEETK